MRRKSREPRAAWAIQSTFVPCRDGPRRLERAFLALLDARTGADGIVSSIGEENHHESRRLCQGLDREVGEWPDDRQPTRGSPRLGRGSWARTQGTPHLHR